MQVKTDRRSIDLSSFPDLIVVYLGLRVTGLRGIATVVGLSRGISESVRAQPDGLLAHEPIFYSLTHIGMRQYWRDMTSLERFTRSEPHKIWWKDFLDDTGGTGFWHETYARQGGMEAIYINMPGPIGFGLFAPERKPQGPFMSARNRLSARGRGQQPY